MSIVKIIEVISEGKSMDDAVKSALKEASKTVQNIKSVDILHFHAIVENNAIVKYRLDAKVAFVVDEKIKE
jgi:flavin-binding protein dodecin